jgi:hypothetical protein
LPALAVPGGGISHTGVANSGKLIPSKRYTSVGSLLHTFVPGAPGAVPLQSRFVRHIMPVVMSTARPPPLSIAPASGWRTTPEPLLELVVLPDPLLLAPGPPDPEALLAENPPLELEPLLLALPLELPLDPPLVSARPPSASGPPTLEDAQAEIARMPVTPRSARASLDGPRDHQSASETRCTSTRRSLPRSRTPSSRRPTHSPA